MNRIIDIAVYITSKYEQSTGIQMTEKKLHNLLYLTQRETLAVFDQPAFNEPLEGWVYGPASREVRSWFQSGKNTSRSKEVSFNNKYIIDQILTSYGNLSDQKLSNLTRTETSWINSREGLGKKEAGDRYLKLDDIRQDSLKLRPCGPYWDILNSDESENT